MKKNFIIIILAGVILALTVSIFWDKQADNGEAPKKIIALSTFALYDIAKHITRDTFELVSIIPAGVDIHSYEPTPQMMAKLEKSDLAVYSGGGLEPWIESFTFKGRAIGIANYIKLRKLAPNEFDTHGHHDSQCAHNTIDPHYWLDIDNMKRAADLLTYEFIGLAPKHKQMFLENREKYITMLNRIDTMYKEKLSSCRVDTIVVNHNAFTYLSNKYNFKVESLTGLSPEAESSPRDMMRIMNDVKKHQIRTIFFETFLSDKSMKTLATDVNVKVDV
ncbi:zinc ABC transporter substrate-binding protein, partial [Sulfurimonas sp. SAG-AH-194-I05]